MIRMTLRTLASFVVLAEELHFTRAARRLNVAQPALTKHVQQLEAEIGVTLFVRDRRSVRLTANGELLVDRAKAVLDGSRNFEETAAAIRAGAGGRLRVGFTPTAPYLALPAVVRLLRRNHPEIECILRESSSADQLHALEAGALDVGILRPPAAPRSGLVCRPFSEERFVAVLPPDHRLSRRKEVALADLAADPFILVARRTVPGVYDQIVAACHAAGFSPRVSQDATQPHTVVALVASGMGVSVLPESTAQLRVPDVAYRPLAGAPLRSILATAYLATNRSRAVRAFLAAAASNKIVTPRR
jgi:DNA-binding transcriptional LysR family regulator